MLAAKGPARAAHSLQKPVRLAVDIPVPLLAGRSGTVTPPQAEARSPTKPRGLTSDKSLVGKPVARRFGGRWYEGRVVGRVDAEPDDDDVAPWHRAARHSLSLAAAGATAGRAGRRRSVWKRRRNALRAGRRRRGARRGPRAFPGLSLVLGEPWEAAASCRSPLRTPFASDE